MEDFLGLRVLWPKPGQGSAQIKHKYDCFHALILQFSFNIAENSPELVSPLSTASTADM